MQRSRKVWPITRRNISQFRDQEINETMKLEDKYFKTVNINVQGLKEKLEINKERNGNYEKDPNGTSKIKNIIPEMKN